MTAPIYEVQDAVIAWTQETADGIVVYFHDLDVVIPEEATGSGMLVMWMLATAYLAFFFYLYLHYDRTSKHQLLERKRAKSTLRGDYEDLLDRQPLISSEVIIEHNSDKYPM